MKWIFATLLALAAVGHACAQAAAYPAASLRLRGTVEKIDATSLTLRERSGEVYTLALAPNLVVIEVLPIALSALRRQADGTPPADVRDGTPTVTRVLAGRDGFAPPL